MNKDKLKLAEGILKTLLKEYNISRYYERAEYYVSSVKRKTLPKEWGAKIISNGTNIWEAKETGFEEVFWCKAIDNKEDYYGHINSIFIQDKEYTVHSNINDNFGWEIWVYNVLTDYYHLLKKRIFREEEYDYLESLKEGNEENE